MKRFLALAALVLGLASCQTEPEGLGVNVGGEVDTTITVTIPETETRAGGNNSALSIFDNGVLGEENDNKTMRYILEIYYKNELFAERLVDYSDGKTVTFPVRLVPGRQYNFVVWADYVESNDDTDFHYNTTSLENTDGVKYGLTNVTLIDTKENPWEAMDETRDAFTGFLVVNSYSGSQSINIPLTRPFAKLRVMTTDMVELGNLGIIPTSAKVTYETKFHKSFNACDGKYGEETVEKVHNFNYADVTSYTDQTGANKVLFTDYFFADASDVVKFELDVYEVAVTAQNDDVNRIKHIDFKTDIPAQRNYLTTIQGHILTEGNNIEVTVNGAFENAGNLEDEPYYVEIWDGESIESPKLVTDPTTGEAYYSIENGSQLAWLAAAVSGTLTEEYTRATVEPNSFKGQTFVLTQNVDLGGNEWTPIGMGGKHFEGTFDGQGHTIKGLMVSKRHGADQAALFCSLAGDATIKNVVIDDAYVKYPANGDDFYASAIAGTIYGTITFENITVKNSTITGNNKVGAIFAHDGVSTQITINNCHVDNCYIASEDLKDGGNVGGLIGLFQTGSEKESKISNSSVKNSTIVGINSSNSGKRANSEFIGGIYTKKNTNLVIENCVVEGNTFSQTIDGTEAVTYIGTYDPQFIGGDREEKHLGKVVINGSEAIYVSNAIGLQNAINTITNGVIIRFACDIEGDVTVVQKAGVKIDIDGNGNKYNGSIKVHSNSEHYATAALTIKNVNFETSSTYKDKNGATCFNFVEALENGSERYSTNITVEDCTFTATDDAQNIAVGLQIKSSKWAKVLNCTANNMHSLIQAQSCDETVVVNGCTINGKNGVAFKQVKAATVEGTTIVAAEYGIRFDGNTDNYGIVVKNNNVTANQPFIVRKMTGKNNTITLEGENTLTTDAEYQIVITNGSDDQEYVKPTGTYTLTGADEYTLFPVSPVAKVGNTEYTSIDEAIANWTKGSTLTLLKNVTLTDVITLKSTEHHILDLGTYTMTAASGKHAIEITCNGLSNATYALTINADTTNPGGITATGKSCIYYKKSDTTKDRPIILINNGVFTGSYSINSTSNGNTNCPQVWINGGVFNSYMSLTKNMLKVSGGTFHGAINCTGDSSAYRQISGGRFKSWQFMTADADNKFWVGTAKATYDVGVYVDKEGYLVVGGPVITEFGNKFAAKATNPTKWSSYLKYSSAAANGLYYEDAEMAIKKHGEANVVLK